MDDFTIDLRTFPARYLDREWSSADGLDGVAEAQSLPGSLRAFYRELGSCTELLEMYNTFVPPAELGIEGGYLIFAHESQDVVSWGFRGEDLGIDDPGVWQRNNNEDIWYSEELTLIPFLMSMFDWITAEGQ